jgi:hypothetical protein
MGAAELERWRVGAREVVGRGKQLNKSKDHTSPPE